MSAEVALTDIGPASPPPPWCLPGAVPTTDSVGADGAPLSDWIRDVGDDVWIVSTDQAIDGRMMRSGTEVCLGELRLTLEQARVIAAELGAAIDILDGAATR